MTQDVEFNRVLVSVAFRARAFEKRLDSLDSLHYPTDVAPSLIAELRQELGAHQERLRRIREERPMDPDGAFKRLRSEQRKISALQPYLALIRNSQTLRVPWSLVPAVERFALQLNPGRPTLVTSIDEINYAITFSVAREPVAGWKRFNILCLPDLHRLDVLLHAIVAHELFHPLLARFVETEQGEVAERIRDAVMMRLGDPQSAAGPLFEELESHRRDLIIQSVLETWRRGVEEVGCDLGSVSVFGPAGLFGMNRFSSWFELDSLPKPDDLYPPWRYRLESAFRFLVDEPVFASALAELKLLLEATQELGSESRAFSASLESISRTAAGSRGAFARADEWVKIAYNEVDRALPKLRAFVLEKSCAIRDRWDRVLTEIPQHLLSLKMGVPCGQKTGTDLHQPGRPSSIAAIALAAWIHEIGTGEADSSTDLEKAASDYATRARLALKSVEDSETIRHFLARGSSNTEGVRDERTVT